MLKNINTKAKKIWISWLLGYFVSITVILLILNFVVGNSTISNTFFALMCVTLSLIVVSYLSGKKTNYNEYNSKDFTMTDETVRAYIPDVKKINQDTIVKVRKMRTWYQVTWSCITSGVSLAIALIYAMM